MIGFIKIRERGPTPRHMAKQMRGWLKDAWKDTGVEFHTNYRERRFTQQHAREAGYTKRKGENLPQGSKRWKRSYYGRKFVSRFGGGRNRADPLVYSGKTKRQMRQASITSTSKGVKVRYPGSRALNFRNPRSQVRGGLEFRRILPSEAQELAEFHDGRMDFYMSRDSTASTERVFG